MKFDIESIHDRREPDSLTCAITTPIYQASTFVFEDVGKTRGYDYLRTSNPTKRVLGDALAKLED
jgi:cystathionine beta-lyase/cystathionine gamma-synthase